MRIESHSSQGLPAEWSGGRFIIGKWLGRLCFTESLLQLASAGMMLVAGIITFAITSGAISVVVLYVLFVANHLLAVFNLNTPQAQKVAFAVLFLISVGFSTLYACKTRWRSDAVAEINFGSMFSSGSSLVLEFLSAGPIFFVIAVQDFQKYLRLSRVDVPQLSAVLEWLFDHGERAGFAEISLEFPGLNAVRVLPQLRDIPGVYWWPDEGDILLSESLQEILAKLLHREPRKTRGHARPSPKPPPFGQPSTPGVSDEMLAWYAILKLPPFATLQQVKKAYRKLAKIHHPDARVANSSIDESAGDDQMKRINEAYHNIINHSQSQAGNPDSPA